jgi:hypothetical protein
MMGQERVEVRTGKKLTQHAVEVRKALGDVALMERIRDRYPNVNSISLVQGNRFHVQGTDATGKTLTCTINPSKPKDTSRLFKQEFRPKERPAGVEPEFEVETVSLPGLDGIGLVAVMRPRGEREKPQIQPEEQERPEIPDRRQIDWPEITVPEDVANSLAFHPNLELTDREAMRQWMEHYYAGSFTGEDRAHSTSIGPQMRGLAEVNLYRLKVKPEVLGYICAYPFKANIQTYEAVVPIIGGFFGAEGEITDELERKGFIERVRDDTGNPVTIPAFEKNARQILFPVSKGTVNLYKVDGRLILPNSPEAVTEIWEALHPQGRATLEELARGNIKAKYDALKPQLDYTEFEHREWQLAVHVTGLEYLKRMLREGDTGLEGQLDLTRIEEVKRRVCGFGVKGPGCICYDGHHVRYASNGSVPLPDNHSLVEEHETSAMIVDEGLKGSRGLMLTIPHQQWSGVPVGAASILHFLIFDRENELLKNGAELSYFTTGVMPLLSKEQVPELCTDQIAVVTNVVLDDTRRLEDFIDPDIELTELQKYYKWMVVSKYGPEMGEEEDQDEYTERSFESSRDAHWTTVCANMGRNLKAMFASGLTNPRDQNFFGNISLDGGLCDTLDLARMRHSREFHSTLEAFFKKLTHLYTVAAFEDINFFASKYFKTLLDEAVGVEEAGKLTERISGFLERDEPDERETKAARAVGLLADVFQRIGGEEEKSVWEMDGLEFLGLMDGNDELRVKARLRKESIPAYRQALTEGEPVGKVVGGVAIPIDPERELDIHRMRADEELRANTAMSMVERTADLKKMFTEKFGGTIF